MLVNIFGKRGSGKTTTIRGQLRHCPSPVVVIDILGNFDNEEFIQVKSASEAILKLEDWLNEHNKRQNGSTIARFLGGAKRSGTDTTDDTGSETGNASSSSGSRPSIETSHGENAQGSDVIIVQTADPNLTVDYLCPALWELGRGTLVLDEVDALEFSGSPCFDQLIRYGRNRNISVLTGCRRPAEVPRSITAGANKQYIFGTHEPRDLDYFRTTILGDRAEQLMRMPKFTGIFVDYDKSTIGNFGIDINGEIFHTSEESV